MKATRTFLLMLLGALLALMLHPPAHALLLC